MYLDAVSDEAAIERAYRHAALRWFRAASPQVPSETHGPGYSWIIDTLDLPAPLIARIEFEVAQMCAQLAFWP